MVILDELVSALASYAADKVKEEVALLAGVPEEIEKLKEHLVVINAVLADAERRELVGDGSIKIWLDNLRDIVYDIEDVLEDVQEVLSPKNEVKPGDNEEEEEKKVCFPSCIKKIKKIPRFLFKKSKEVKARHDIARRMEEINVRLDLIAKLKDQYKLVEAVGGIDETRNERRMTTAFGKFVPNLAAQTAIRNQVAEKLRDNQDGKNVQVISLVGMGGIGKTTIARMVFNDEAIRAQFHKLIWVCVSDHFDEKKVAIAIAQAIVDDERGVAELNQLHQVLERINESIRAKKFFLVLDDVWTESNENWDGIFSCLNRACSPGSKVLVTTRSHWVAQKMQTDFMVPVNQLEDEECFLLFRHFAFNGRAEGECQSLESIAKEMAKRCKGLPLTAETLGKAMAYKRTWREWNAILGSNLWKFEDVKKGLLPALSISYIDLPSPIKRCFSYCSIFQKDEEIEKEDLIRIWMGLGFLSSEAEGSRKMEDVGEEYLNSLVARSFFQDCPEEGAVKMHDIIHDFAQYLTKNESLVVLGDGGGSRKIRHLNVPSRLAQLSTLSINMEYLRTLFLRDVDSSDDDYSDVLLKLSRARVLKLEGSMICMIPSEIGKLTHLRYINFSACEELKELPESICDLSALQTLDISACRKLEKLPEGIGKLIHLRHLDALLCEELKELPESICDLSALQTLDIIGCKKLVKLPKGIGKLIGLRHLDALLCEELMELPESICDLSALEKLNIGMCTKLEKLPKGIGKLIGLRHLYASQCTELKELPESICDLSALEKLDICMCTKLEKLPKGIGKLIGLRHLDASNCTKLKELPESICDLSALETLEIWGCRKLEKLPPLGRLPLLEFLYIGRMDRVRKVGKELLGIIEEAEGVGHEEDYQPTLTSNSFVAFPKLRKLYFFDLPEWTTWADPEHDNNIQFIIMPSLSDLRIEDCPKLQALPRFVAGAPIKKLRIKSCLKLEKLPPLGRLPLLESLRISWMSGVRNVGKELLGIIEEAEGVGHEEDYQPTLTSNSFVAFPKLRKLSFVGLSEWTTWTDPEHDNNIQFTIMPSLLDLLIYGCPKMQALPRFLAGAPIKKLYIENCSLIEKSIKEGCEGYRWVCGIPECNLTFG